MRTFVQLVDAGTATKAAEIRGLAISAISRRMKDLETRLGVQLLQRTTRRMHLTDEGQLYYDAAQRILGDLADIEAQVSQKNRELTGTLRLAAPVSFGTAHLSPAICAFMHEHPNLVVRMDLNDRHVDLVEEGFDLAIRIGKLKDSNMMARKIAGFHHLVCAAPSFFDTHGVPQHPSDLRDLPGLCYGNLPNPPLWSYRDPMGETGSVLLKRRFEATNGDALRDAAIAGLGVLCEPSFIVHRAVADGLLRSVLTEYQWYDMAIYAVYPATQHVPMRVRALIDFLAGRFGDAPYWNDVLKASAQQASVRS